MNVSARRGRCTGWSTRSLIASAAAWQRCIAAGRDVFIGGGRSSVFLRGADGDDMLVGGLANDALGAETGMTISMA